MTGKPILSLDQGTTSSRAIVFGQDGRALSMAQRELPQIYPAPGDVEHDPEEIWQTQLACAREALARAGLSASQIGSLGITNQRETTILWDKTTGTPVANAIVWQSRVSAPVCDRLKAQGHEALIRQRTVVADTDPTAPNRENITAAHLHPHMRESHPEPKVRRHRALTGQQAFEQGIRFQV